MKCPGQDSRYWQPGAIFESKCPHCGQMVEFFKDDATRKCSHCGNRLANPKMDFGCASYCKFAEQCIGSLPDELMARREDLLKDRIAVEMKKYFQKDFQKIGHAMRVARHAEKIGQAEAGNMAVILASAYLHDIDDDIDFEETEKEYGPPAIDHLSPENLPVARILLKNLGAADNLIKEVCIVVNGHHHIQQDQNINSKVLHDAHLMANLEDAQKKEPVSQDKVRKIIDDSLLTQSGRELALRLFL